MSYALFAIRGELLVVFAAAVIAKIRARDGIQQLAESIRTLNILPAWMSTPVSMMIIGVEAAIAVMLLVTATIQVGLSLAVATLGVFTTVIVFSITSGHRTTCECFGADGAVLALRHVVRNALLIASAAAGLVLTLHHHQASVVGASGASIVALVAGAIVGFVFTEWDELSFVLFGEVPLRSM